MSVILLMIAGMDRTGAAQATEPTTVPATRPAPATEPSEAARVLWGVEPEVREVIRRLDAADRSLKPTILLWLGSEQDGRRVGRGWSRMLVAMRGVSRLQIKEAVPWLITIYDNPTADALARNAAAETAIRIDPFYSVEFLREALDDATLRSSDPADPLVSCRCEAAVALSTIGDEHARSILLDAMLGHLDSLNRGGPQRGPGARNWHACLAMSRCADLGLASRLTELQPHYLRQPARGRLAGMIEQIRFNALPVDELMRRLHSDRPAARTQAVIALGVKGGPEVIDDLRAVERKAATGQSEATTRPSAATTQPADELLSAVLPPASTRPSPAEDAELIIACRAAIDEIETRNPVPVPDSASTAASTRPTALPHEESVPDDAELLWLDQVSTRQVHNVKSPVVIFYDPAGLLPPIQLVVKDDGLFARLHQMPYGLLARVQLADGGAELGALRFQSVAPGELTPDGYVLVARRTVRAGQWEHEAVVLRRFGKETTALIPNRRKSGGQFRPDARMIRTLDAVATGQTVEAAFEPGEGPTILRSLAPYRPPIAARIVKFVDPPAEGAGRAAVELEIARKRMAYLLPAADTPYATLSGDQIRALPVAAAVKVIVDDAADSPALLAVRLDGGVTGRADGSRVGGRAGALAFWADRDRDYAGTFQIVGREQFKSACLRAGLGRFLQAPGAGGLPAEKVAAMNGVIQRGGPIFGSGDIGEIKVLAARWAAADRGERGEIESQIVRKLGGMSATLVRRSEGEERELRSILSAAQYNQILSLGGWATPALRPPATTRPVTPR